MKRLLTILLLFAAIIPCSAKKMGAYLMVYHKDCDHSLHMAISYDGYTWTALRDDKPVFSGDSIAVQHGIRDPHIFRGHEAPNCWQRIGEEKYILMFDNYSMRPHNFGFVETTDFRTFSPIGHFDEEGSPMRRTNFAEQKHGAVIQITKKEAKRMEKFWNAIK